MIYDELDLPFGTIRIRQRGGTAGHNGMESVLGALGTDEFLRIRLGIAPDRKVGDGAQYVLAPFRKAQEKVVDEILDAAAQAVEVILKDGVAAAMTKFNRKHGKWALGIGLEAARSLRLRTKSPKPGVCVKDFGENE